MKLSNEYILNKYADRHFSRELAYELLIDNGVLEETAEIKLDLALQDEYNVEEKITEMISEEKSNECSIIHSSIIDDNDIKELLLRFSQKLLK